MSATNVRKRRKRTNAVGIVLTAVGLVVLVLCLAHLGGAVLLACQAVGGLILGMAGFAMMVVGADPFADDDGQFPTVDDADTH